MRAGVGAPQPVRLLRRRLLARKESSSGTLAGRSHAGADSRIVTGPVDRRVIARLNSARHLVYDGECPLCSRYARMIRLEQSIGPVELVSARDDHPVVRELLRDGYDLDQGVAFVDGDEIYFGEECMTRLALLSTPVGLFNRMNAAVFRSPRATALVYPIFRTGRRILLRLLGRRPLGRSNGTDLTRPRR